jgi:hypothetical protein
MQGHNVVFDWENGRVGFAESSCAYDKKDVPESATDDGYSTDCVVGDPILTNACIESVDKSLCRHNPTNIALLGTEKWTSKVESPGTGAGISCIEAANDVSHRDPREKPVVQCNGEGVCEEERPCQLTCSETIQANEVIALPESQQSRSQCGKGFWSACDYNCKQTRIASVAYSDGFCHEKHRESRPCHIGACSRSDPCRVPFVVHAVVGFKRGSLSKWTEASQDAFLEALVGTAQRISNRKLFLAGDVNVLLALPWYEDETDISDLANQRPSDIRGFRVAVEVSVFNDRALMQPPDFEVSSIEDRATLRENACGAEALYWLAKHALAVKKEVFLKDGFMNALVNEMKASTIPEQESAFKEMFVNGVNANDEHIVSAWTVRTEIDDEINYFGPQKPFMAKLYTVLSGATVASTLFLIFLSLWSLLWICDDFSQGRLSLSSAFAFVRQFGSRNHVTEVNDNEDVNAIEERALLGSDSTPSKSTYKFTTPKKRNRTSSGVLSNESGSR